jgi:hypothetical protein
LKFGHPDDDANQGRLPNPTGHGGVYKVDGHGRPEPSVGGGELNFSSMPWGQELPPTPSIFFPIGLAGGLSRWRSDHRAENRL